MDSIEESFHLDLLRQAIEKNRANFYCFKRKIDLQ